MRKRCRAAPSRCCLAGLPDPGQAIPTRSQWETQRQGSVLMGQKPNRFETFGAFLEGLENPDFNHQGKICLPHPQEASGCFRLCEETDNSS